MLNCIQTSGSKVMVKSLFDTSSSPFMGNSKLLIKDDDPTKEAVMKQARERHEEYLKKKQEQNDSENLKIQERSDIMRRILD